MKPRTPWLPEHDKILEEWSGRKSAKAIGEITGHCEKTVLQHQQAIREARGLPSYHHKRANWTRRDYLLAGAAGMMTPDASA